MNTQVNAPAAPAPDPYGALPLGKLVQMYVKLRDVLAEQDLAHKKKTAPGRELLQALNGHLSAKLDAAGVDSVATPDGTAYKKSKKSATLADASVFRQFVIDNGLWDMVDWKANAKATEDYIKENNGLPPGINYSVVVDVGVRRK